MNRYKSVLIGACIILLSYFLKCFHNSNNIDVELKGWERNKSRNVSDFLDMENTNPVIKPIGFCETNSSSPVIWMFVNSHVKNVFRRKVIRETWGNYSKFNYSLFNQLHGQTHKNYLNITEKWAETLNTAAPLVQLVFLVGVSENYEAQKILAESQKYNDILQENLVENYLNLTLKSLYILKWASSVCFKSTAFFVKVDDDVFVNIPNLIHVLLGGTLPLYTDLKYFYDFNTVQNMRDFSRIKEHQGLLLGDMWNLTPALRDSNLKYYSPYYMYEKKVYPPFLSGYAYVMSNDVAQKLYRTALETKIFHLEDVFVTGILASKCGVKRRRSHLFSFKKLDTVCGLRGVIFENGRHPDDFSNTINLLLDSDLKCTYMSEWYVKHLYKIVFYALEPLITMWNNYKFWFPPKIAHDGKQNVYN